MMLKKLLLLILVLGLSVGSASGVDCSMCLYDNFEDGILDLDMWQTLNGPDVGIIEDGGQLFFNRPETQLNYLLTTCECDPAVTPLCVMGSASTGPEGLAIWTRASNTGNTNGPAHVLDQGIRSPLWPEGENSGWYDGEIIRKDPGVWGWTGLAVGQIPGEKSYEWDFKITDDGTTITATWTQATDPTNTFTLTTTETAHYDTNYVAITVINGYLNDISICCIPEPATVGLLGLGGLALLRRKR